MSDRRQPPSFLKRVVGWVLLVGGFGVWLFSAEIFPGNGQLYDAIAAGDSRAVTRLLAAGADPNSQRAPLTLTRTSTRRYMYSPLVYALRRNQPDVALALIEGGADPNSRDLDGKTALAMATANHMTAVVSALIAKGARPQASAAGR